MSDKEKQLKQAMKNYKRMDHKTKKLLKELGFEIERGKKHYVIRHANNPGSGIILSKSGSEYRSGRNCFCHMHKALA